jgi:hypothetical protein
LLLDKVGKRKTAESCVHSLSDFYPNILNCARPGRKTTLGIAETVRKLTPTLQRLHDFGDGDLVGGLAQTVPTVRSTPTANKARFSKRWHDLFEILLRNMPSIAELTKRKSLALVHPEL